MEARRNALGKLLQTAGEFLGSTAVGAPPQSRPLGPAGSRKGEYGRPAPAGVRRARSGYALPSQARHRLLILATMRQCHANTTQRICVDHSCRRHHGHAFATGTRDRMTLRSRVTSVRPRNRACANNSRSNGSRWSRVGVTASWLPVVHETGLLVSGRKKLLSGKRGNGVESGRTACGNHARDQTHNH